jgi:hypothetical protein
LPSTYSIYWRLYSVRCYVCIQTISCVNIGLWIFNLLRK